MRNPEHVLRTTTSFRLPVEEVFRFFATAENLQLITPRELNFRIVTPQPIYLGRKSIIDYKLGLFGFEFDWKTEITVWNPPFEFVDTQLEGPYAQWVHRHSFREKDGVTIMDDVVRWRLPVPLFGEVAYPFVRLQVGRIFKYRSRKIKQLLNL